jgi:hypothetical protein
MKPVCHLVGVVVLAGGILQAFGILHEIRINTICAMLHSYVLKLCLMPL